MKKTIVTPILIQIIYPTTVIILLFFLLVFAKPATGYVYVLPLDLLVLVFPQAILVVKYLLYFPFKEYYLSNQAFYIFNERRRNVLRRYYSPKDYFKRGRYEKPVVQYQYVVKILYPQIFFLCF